MPTVVGILRALRGFPGGSALSRAFRPRLSSRGKRSAPIAMPSDSLVPAEERAMQYALRVLAYRARSESEMRQRLQRKGFTPQVTDRTLAELARLGLLDDREFARSWVASRPGRGPARLKQELRLKGVARDLAEEVIDTGLSAEDEVARAWTVAVRALRPRATPPDREELLRVRRLLQRRGFSFEAIGRVCARLNDRLTAEGDWLE